MAAKVDMPLARAARPTGKISGIIFHTERVYPGRGIRNAVACIPSLSIHVPFEYEYRMPETNLIRVGFPTECDGTCKKVSEEAVREKLEDFNTERNHRDFSVKPILEAALSFAETPNG